MFSGKSSRLLKEMKPFMAIGKRCLIINSKKDTRTGDCISTHDQMELPAIKVDNLCTLLGKEILESCDVIGIDEAQFFPDLKEFILSIEKTSKMVFLAGLDGDYKRRPFGQILDCIPLCDKVEKLTAMDMASKDGSKALFTKRILEEDNTQIKIGAKDIYMAVNRHNFLNT